MRPAPCAANAWLCGATTTTRAGLAAVGGAAFSSEQPARQTQATLAQRNVFSDWRMAGLRPLTREGELLERISVRGRPRSRIMTSYAARLGARDRFDFSAVIILSTSPANRMSMT